MPPDDGDATRCPMVVALSSGQSLPPFFFFFSNCLLMKKIINILKYFCVSQVKQVAKINLMTDILIFI